ncbi:MAG: ABC transporter substrate-binding protein [Bacillota bacterium]|nr:ABC transporter substrate-binding protein [Bacillota bacterium]
MKMKKLLGVCMAVLFLALLPACSKTEDQSKGPQASIERKTIVDDLGRQVEVPEKVERIVVLGNTPRMITYLGLADKVVGLSIDVKNLDPQTAYAYANRDLWWDLPLVGSGEKGNVEYYPEEIIKANPDLILCSFTEDIVKDLETKTGLPVVSVAMGTLFAKDYDQALRTLGQACGVEERAEEVVAYIHSCLEDLEARTANITEDQKPSIISAAASYKGINGIESVRVQDSVLDSIKAKNLASQDQGPVVAFVDKEQILAWDPDYIFCDFEGVGLVKEDYKTNPDFYRELKAFQKGQVFQQPSASSYFSNLEIPLLNAYYIGSVLYPENFADLDINKKAQEIFKFFLDDENYLQKLESAGAFYGPINFNQ